MRRQRGALTFVTPLLMVIVVLLSTMALDGARLYSLRQDMQSQVNAAATAAADGVQTCGGQDVDMATIRQRALTAARGQGFTGEDGDLVVQAGLLQDSDGDGDIEFRTMPFLDQSNAVHVSYRRSARISMLLPETQLGSVDMEVSAAVRKEAVATLSAAGSTAGVGGGLLGSLLGAVLGDAAYTLDPTSLSSLQNTTVELGELLNTLGVNDIAGLLPLGGDELAGALSTISGVTTSLGRTLDDIAGAAGIETIKVGDILSVVGESRVPENSEFPLYDVVISLVLNIAEQQQPGSDGILDLPINIDNLSIPLLANINTVDVGLHVGEPPTVAIGPARRGETDEWVTRFHAPDITLALAADVELLNVDLGLASLNLASLNIPLAVAVGGGQGAFVAADCAKSNNNDVEVTVELEREVARIATGSVGPSGSFNQEDIDAQVGRLRLFFGLIPVLDPAIQLTAGLDVSVPAENQTVTLDPRYPLYCSPESGCARQEWEDQGAGLGGLDLGVELKKVELLGLDLGVLLQPITDALQALLNGVVNSLAQALINPLLQTLGVGLGGISVTVSGVDQSNIQLIENVAVSGDGT
ncbi:hypothetical protein [Alloalcanivorax marinus]|uniref:hypothetical protein n=1 Tax=Alloalcanivorax marinus TaxID=1177169 RepID=UPI0019331A88|nr:hypothetical protein [Alloalcanivorax marinus]MBL7252066.1 hypothetical protein [Alloalcanivorax marinus]